jgi:cyanate permease
MAPIVAWWIEDFGWRTAWVLLGGLVWALILPSALVIRRAPEDMGLYPDDMTPEQAEVYSAVRQRLTAGSEVQWTRPQALRTRSLWLIILAFGTANVGLGAMLLHLISYLTDSGFSRPTAAFLFSVMSWAALLSKALWGGLMDRFHARYLSAVGFVISGVSIVGLLGAGEARSEALVALALAGYGLGIGGVIPLQETVWASYFGRTHLGKIRSVAMPFSIIFSAGGPLLAGTLYDRSGSYTNAFLLFVMFYVLGLILILLARPPRPPEGPAAEEGAHAPEGAAAMGAG